MFYKNIYLQLLFYEKSQSISTSNTYDVFLVSLPDMLEELRRMARIIHKRVIEGKYFYKTITITLRDSLFKTITRQKTLDNYESDLYVIYDTIEDLLDKYYEEGKSYRLLGVGVSNLALENEILEYNLFNLDSFDEKKASIKSLLNRINNDLGYDAIDFIGSKEKNKKS